jgi:hypothetical protein
VGEPSAISDASTFATVEEDLAYAAIGQCRCDRAEIGLNMEVSLGGSALIIGQHCNFSSCQEA